MKRILALTIVLVLSLMPAASFGGSLNDLEGIWRNYIPAADTKYNEHAYWRIVVKNGEIIINVVRDKPFSNGIVFPTKGLYVLKLKGRQLTGTTYSYRSDLISQQVEGTVSYDFKEIALNEISQSSGKTTSIHHKCRTTNVNSCRY